MYRVTADIAVRIKYQKQLWSAVVTMQTVLQNIIDTHTVDYSWLSGNARLASQWWTQNIPLLDATKQKTALAFSGWVLSYKNASGVVISLLWPDIIFTWQTFILSPTTNPVTEPLFSRIYHPGFWLIGTVKPIEYNEINFPVHTFFSFLQK